MPTRKGDWHANISKYICMPNKQQLLVCYWLGDVLLMPAQCMTLVNSMALLSDVLSRLEASHDTGGLSMHAAQLTVIPDTHNQNSPFALCHAMRGALTRHVQPADGHWAQEQSLTQRWAATLQGADH